MSGLLLFTHPWRVRASQGRMKQNLRLENGNSFARCASLCEKPKRLFMKGTYKMLLVNLSEVSKNALVAPFRFLPYSILAIYTTLSKDVSCLKTGSQKWCKSSHKSFVIYFSRKWTYLGS